jgi:hypothetical protein
MDNRHRLTWGNIQVPSCIDMWGLKMKLRCPIELAELETILKNHCVETMRADGKLFALCEWCKNSVVFSMWVDVTQYRKVQLYHWLGY